MKSMYAKFHPCHYAHNHLANADKFKTASLFECRVFGVPSQMDGVTLFFTNIWKASRFLEARSEEAQEFKASPVEINQIWKKSQDQKGLSFAIDPCGLCGFFEPIIINPTTTREQLELLISKSIGFSEIQNRKYLEDAISAIDKNNIDLAIDTLTTLVSHLDCSIPESHYLMGVCGKKINDEKLVTEARNNLKQLSQEWLEKLDQILKK
jgi:hypothetical protein